MASGREILQRPLDAGGLAVNGLPHAATADAAERHDDVVSQISTAVAAEAAARAAADALIPGTITALTGDVTATGTGSVAATLANLPQAVLIARTGALTADLPLNNHKTTGQASGGTTLTNGANIGDVLAASALSVANETALAAIDATNLPTGTRVWVATYRCFWVLDKSTTRTALANLVRAATGGAGWWWVRQLTQGDPFWQNQAAWWIDPAGTAATPGNDEADGLSSSTQLKSMAEWRRRVRGAAYGGANPSIVVINATSGSTLLDDGQINGVTTVGLAAIIIMGTPTVVGTGTLTGAVAYAGNNRGTVTDSALPTSWTSSYGLSSTSGSRYIRRVGGAGPAQSLLLQESTPKTAMIGLTTDTSETSTGTPTVNTATWSNGDVYQVVSRPVWPPLLAMGCRARLQCLDVSGQHFTTNFDEFDAYVLCGYLSNANSLCGNILAYNCGFFGSVVVQTGSFAPFSCSFLNICEITTGVDWAFTENVFLGGGSNLHNHHGGVVEGTGLLHFFDNTTFLIQTGRGNHTNIDPTNGGAVVGSGNTGKFVQVFGGGKVTGAAAITAATSDPLPYQINSISFSTPIVDGGSGDGVYS